MFHLTKEEADSLRFQIGILKTGEHAGKRAIQVNIQIVRTVTKIREFLASHKELNQKIEAMEKKYDHQFKVVFDAIRQWMVPPERKKKAIGFKRESES